ncbi:MAG: transcriptional repressor LexA [Myxococcota bacterium]|jgi:repressor LexA|nr:transcriptional repressor LexA [Myxococcota bacterium]
MSPKTPPGQTRDQIFRFVRERLFEGLPPTVREVQQAFGFKSVQTAREHLETLVAEGRLTKAAGLSRGYRLAEGLALPAMALVPLLGQVQAGELTTAVEEPEGYIPVPSRQAAEGMFALRVRGRSMIDAGILPGDLVLVRRQSAAEPGDIVVALVEDEATVKRLRRRNGRLELHPENPEFFPIVPEPGALVILGKVIEVRRHLEGMPVYD